MTASCGTTRGRGRLQALQEKLGGIVTLRGVTGLPISTYFFGREVEMAAGRGAFCTHTLWSEVRLAVSARVARRGSCTTSLVNACHGLHECGPER